MQRFEINVKIDKNEWNLFINLFIIIIIIIFFFIVPWEWYFV